MYTTAVFVTAFFVVLGFAMILVSELKQLRTKAGTTDEKVSGVGFAGEILGGVMLFVAGLFTGAAIIGDEPQQALRAFARPEVMRQRILGGGTSVASPVPPDIGKVKWDGGSRSLEFTEAPPAGHFWVLSYNSTRIPIPGAATQNIPAGVDQVEIYLQRQNPPATSVAVPFTTK